MGFPGGSDGKESACNVGDQGLISGFGRSPVKRNSLPTPIFWPGEFHGQRSLAGYSPWGCKESDTPGSAGDYQADEQAGVGWLTWRVSDNEQAAVRGLAGEYQAD